MQVKAMLDDIARSRQRKMEPAAGGATSELQEARRPPPPPHFDTPSSLSSVQDAPPEVLGLRALCIWCRCARGGLP